MLKPLQFLLDLPASRDRVWDLWTTESGLGAWLCERANVEPRPGGPYELFWHPDPFQPERDSTFGCKVLSAVRPRLLEFTWRGADAVAEVMNADDAPQTQCKLELTPRPTGTRLRLTHSGWGDGLGWVEARAWFDRAWGDALDRLLGLVSKESPEGP